MMSISFDVQINVYTHKYILAYMHVCVCVYVYTHTNTYTQIVAMLTPVVRDWARARGFHPSVRIYVCMYVRL
jgi:hypothetical protein